MNILILGDIVGKPGREVVKTLLSNLRQEFALSYVIANGENVANGGGFTSPTISELLSYCDVVTSGDHIWDQKGFEKEIIKFPKLLRPANVNKAHPGKGFIIERLPIGGEIAIINLQGRVFMREVQYCPFETIDRILREEKLPPLVIVDFHAEATSEKIAMGYFLDGRITAMVGTHTHVQTNDAKILPKGTAYISDLGMCGAEHSVLGRNVNDVLQKFTIGMPNRLEVEEAGDYQLNGVLLDFDPLSFKARKITPIQRLLKRT